MTIRMMNTGAKFDVVEVGVRSPGYEPMEALRAGDVGYIAASIKDLHDTRVGDTITDDANPAAETAARLPAGEPDGVLRHLSGGRRELREPQGRAGEAAAQRRVADL